MYELHIYLLETIEILWSNSDRLNKFKYFQAAMKRQNKLHNMRVNTTYKLNL